MSRIVAILVVAALASAGSAASAVPTFDSRLVFDTRGHAESIAVGDFNLDGDPDLVVANRLDDAAVTGPIMALLGGAGATFSAATQVSLSAASSVAVGDFNSDSFPDIVYTTAPRAPATGSVGVYVGGPGGTFRGEHSTLLAANSGATSVAIGDFNGDNDPDLAIALSSANRVAILVGLPNGGEFGAPTFLTAGGGPSSVAVGEFNGDTDPDLVVAEAGSDALLVLIGGPGSTFSGLLQKALPLNSDPSSVVVGEFNGDNDRDLAVAAPGTDSVYVLLGTAGLAFSNPPPLRSGGNDPVSVAVGDFNADTDPDLTVANFASDSVSTFIGGAGGSFSLIANKAAGDGPARVAVADFNADGKPDIAVTNRNAETVSILRNSSQASVSATPGSPSFGTQLLGTSSRRQTIALSNVGDAQLEISDIRIVGGQFADFDVVGENCIGDRFLVGEGCGIAVTFTPTAAGTRTASLRLTSTAAGSPQIVPLSGTGVVPSCGGTPATIAGTPGPDAITGTAGADVVALLDGDDTFRGGGGGDRVCGGSGDDDINGEAGDDSLRGGSGDDDIRGDTGSDSLIGRSGDDDLIGGTSLGDSCHGGGDTDTADAGCETITGIP